MAKRRNSSAALGSFSLATSRKLRKSPKETPVWNAASCLKSDPSTPRPQPSKIPASPETGNDRTKPIGEAELFVGGLVTWEANRSACSAFEEAKARRLAH